jgi:hypothetical protein
MISMWIPVIVLVLLVGGGVGFMVLSRQWGRDGAATAVARQWLHGMGGALNEAANILEGDGSLLWLLILIVAFLWLR